MRQHLSSRYPPQLAMHTMTVLEEGEGGPCALFDFLPCNPTDAATGARCKFPHKFPHDTMHGLSHPWLRSDGMPSWHPRQQCRHCCLDWQAAGRGLGSRGGADEAAVPPAAAPLSPCCGARHQLAGGSQTSASDRSTEATCVQRYAAVTTKPASCDITCELGACCQPPSARRTLE